MKFSFLIKYDKFLTFGKLENSSDYRMFHGYLKALKCLLIIIKDKKHFILNLVSYSY